MKEQQPRTKTKTYEVPVSVTRRWKLTPEDITIIKLSLMNFDSRHKELEIKRKSLLNRMKGDFFMVLYAPDYSSSEPLISTETNKKTAKKEEAVVEEKEASKPFNLT